MRRVKVLGALLLVTGVGAAPESARAQTTLSADLGLFSAYVWRGLTLTNGPVAEPDVYLSVPAGTASVTVGGWANTSISGRTTMWTTSANREGCRASTSRSSTLTPR